MVEPKYLRLSREEGPKSGRGSRLTRPADILLYGWRGDRHCCVGLVGVSLARGGKPDAVSALAIVELAKRDKHTQTCASHRFDFVPKGFSGFGSFDPAAQELLDRICGRFRIHARTAELEVHAWVHRCLSFAVMRGVADQFIGRCLDFLGGDLSCVCCHLSLLLLARCASPGCLVLFVIVYYSMKTIITVDSL